MNKFVIGAIVAATALVLGYNAAPTSTPTAQAETTDVVVIGCEFIASAIDGSITSQTVDPLNDLDVGAACGSPLVPVPPATATQPLPPGAAGDPVGTRSIRSLAVAIGDNDTTLEASDFRGDEVDERWDANQLSTDCSTTQGPGDTTLDFGTGLACGLTVFVFVNDEKPVTIDLPSGLATAENGLLDFTCNTDASAIAAIPPALPGGGTGLITQDDDCSDGAEGVTPALGVPNNGDGVVIFHILAAASPGAPSIGDVLTVRVTQEAVEQSFDINVVGPPNNIELALAEDLIETNGSTAQANDCAADVDVTDAISPPNATLLVATATDREDNNLARIPVFTSVDPPGDETTIVVFGEGDIDEDITADTFFTLDPRRPDVAPVAFYQVICGGRGTGTTELVAEINLISCGLTGCTILSSRDRSTAEITVGGAATNTPVPTATNTEVAAPTETPDPGETPAASVTAVRTASVTRTARAGTPSVTRTVTTVTPQPSETPVPSVTNTPVPPSVTNTPVPPSVTSTPVANTATPANTRTRTSTPRATSTRPSSPTQVSTVAAAAVGPRDSGAAGTRALPATGEGAGGNAADWTIGLLSLAAAGVATVTAVAIRRRSR